MHNYTKKKICHFWALIALITLVCCDDELPQQIYLETNQPNNDSASLNFKAIYSDCHTMCWDDATLLAEKTAEYCFDSDDSSTLRSSKRLRLVDKGFVLRRDKSSLRSTKANQLLPDTLAYICNFVDDMGFAVICADDRVGCPILACVDNGTLGDTIDNPGVAIFLENAYNFMEESILKFESEKDSLREIADEYLANETENNAILKKNYTGSFTLVKGEEVKPMLPTTWAQIGTPYNDLTKECSSQESGHAPVGCWATAIGQIMAYYKFPQSISYCPPNSRISYGSTLNWNEIIKEKDANSINIKNTYKLQISKILYGVGINIGMDYECDGSSADEDDAISYMKRIGYLYDGSCNYDFEIIKNQLDLKKPILMNGKSERKSILFWYSYSGGHAWIVDGYSATTLQDYTYNVDIDKGTTSQRLLKTSYENPLIHINWGWGGASNGYYASGCFNTWKAKDFDLSKSKKEHDFKYKQKIHIIWK